MRIGRARPDGLSKGLPVHLGHVHVGDDDVGRVADQPVQGGLGTLKQHGAHAPAFELLVKNAQVQLGVVHQQRQLTCQAGSFQLTRVGQIGAGSGAQAGGEPERRTLSGGRLHANLTAHDVRQALAYRQAQTGTAIFAGSGCIDLAKRLKQSGLAVQRNADTRIFDAELYQARQVGSVGMRGLAQMRTDDHLAMLSEFNRVVDEIQQHLAQPRHVAVDPLRHIRVQVSQQLQPFFSGARGRHVAGFFNGALQAQGLVLQVEFAGLDF